MLIFLDLNVKRLKFFFLYYYNIAVAGRIWAGHNILRFDCARIREAFAEIGRQPPEPKGAIDSLALLTQRFGRRAGDMKVYKIIVLDNRFF